jgi:hypothetical protein
MGHTKNILDAHRLKIQRGSANFCQNPWGEGQGFHDKIARGVPILG